MSEENIGPLLDAEQGDALEARDREHSGPGGEPTCPRCESPRCESPMVRMVEEHRAPRGDDSPFRVRLVCTGSECGAWTVYNW